MAAAVFWLGVPRGIQSIGGLAAGKTGEMNKFENFFGLKGEAKLRYMDGEFQVMVPGDFVRCAVTNLSIPVDELRYWSVERQEAYKDAATALTRYREILSGEVAPLRPE